MTPYVVRKVFSQLALKYWAQADAVVDGIHQDLNKPELRCHEVARVVQRILNTQTPVREEWLMLYDGKYGHVEHSWLTLKNPTGGYFILDPYAVGRLPMVQLIDGAGILPEMRLYNIGDLRDDIDQDWVDATIQTLWEKVPWRK